MKATTRALSLAGVFTLIAVALSGCAAQMTTDEACTYLDTEVSAYLDSVEDDINAASDEFDLEKIVEIQKTMLDEFETISNGVNNAEVKASFGKVVSSTRETIPFVEKMFVEEDMGVLESDEYKEVEKRGADAEEEFSKICPMVSLNP